MRTQPTLPSFVRTRSQSSIGTGSCDFCAFFPALPVSSKLSSLGTDSSSQFSGGFGAGGGGGGGTFDWPPLSFDFLRDVRTGAGATGAAACGAAARGVSLCPITSTRAVSGICQKLGELRFGSVWIFRGSKTVAVPCDGYFDALSAIFRNPAICSGVRSCRLSVHPSAP